MHTIIGANPFHGPVRDGKAWFQAAVAARLAMDPQRGQPMATPSQIAIRNQARWVEIAFYATVSVCVAAMLTVIGSSRTGN